ncbi:hypothetical protein HOY80DRAFT_891228 [Tuber brumale]|nr:hypothetical protein HOY80DRAFT_891228 [Tuber brumale]
MAKSAIGTVESLKHDAKKSLANALEAEELHVNKVNDNLFVGNQRGPDLASLSQRLDKELAIRDLKIAELDEKMKNQKSEFDLAESRNKERLRYLLRSDDSYQAIRDGYLSVHKRDYLGTDTKRDRKIIAERNTTVHWGDARSDAALYTKPGGRMDPEVFEKLYGLLPEKMGDNFPLFQSIIERSCLGNDKTVHVLNIQAGVLASNFKKSTRKFSDLFAAFVGALEKSGFDETYPDDKQTEVTIAYRAFVDCTRKEVKEVRPKRRK